MEAFQAGKEYIEGLGVKAKKYEVCGDPRILNIYQDKDKGVAKGYRNKNIFVLEYMDNNGKWKYIFYDIDSGFFRTTQNTFNEYTNPRGMGSWNFPTVLLRNMMKSSEFKSTFLERLSYNLNNTWAYKNVEKRIDEVIDEIGKEEFKKNAERWGNSYSHWEKSIKSMKTFAKKRNSYVVKYAKSYFNLSSSDVKKYFGDVE